MSLDLRRYSIKRPRVSDRPGASLPEAMNQFVNEKTHLQGAYQDQLVSFTIRAKNTAEPPVVMMPVDAAVRNSVF